MPVLRASQAAQDHIEDLLQKQKSSQLTPDEEQELQQYEDVDGYLSYLNRLTRNLATARHGRESCRVNYRERIRHLSRR